MVLIVKKVITDKRSMPMHEHSLVKVNQDEESGEPEIPPPERIRNPGVIRIIIRRRCIVSDYRRPFVVIVVVYDRRIRIVVSCHVISGLIRRPDGQIILPQNVLKRLQCFIFTHGQAVCIRCITHRTLQFAYDIRCDRIIGDPAVTRRDTDCSQLTFRFNFVRGRP
jgi:hypothetical protein